MIRTGFLFRVLDCSLCQNQTSTDCWEKAVLVFLERGDYDLYKVLDFISVYTSCTSNLLGMSSQHTTSTESSFPWNLYFEKTRSLPTRNQKWRALRSINDDNALENTLSSRDWQNSYKHKHGGNRAVCSQVVQWRRPKVGGRREKWELFHHAKNAFFPAYLWSSGELINGILFFSQVQHEKVNLLDIREIIRIAILIRLGGLFFIFGSTICWRCIPSL